MDPKLPACGRKDAAVMDAWIDHMENAIAEKYRDTPEMTLLGRSIVETIRQAHHERGLRVTEIPTLLEQIQAKIEPLLPGHPNDGKQEY